MGLLQHPDQHYDKNNNNQQDDETVWTVHDELPLIEQWPTITGG
jgi:hypothetical protein